MIEAYLAHLRLTGRSPYTTYEWGLLLHRADRELPHGLDYAADQELLQWLGRSGWSAATRSAYHAALSSFYRWATRPTDPWLDLDPMRDVPRPRKDRPAPRPVTDAELGRILHAREPYYTWAVLAAYAGARCIEVSRLDREHVTEQHLRLHGKGDKRRTVPTHPLVWRTLADRPAGPVARDRSGARYTGRAISRNATMYLHHQLGLPGVSMHRLRHWFLTGIQRAGKDLRVTQQLAGHASPATTAGYAAVADEHVSRAVQALPDLAAPQAAGPDAAAGAAPPAQ